MAKTTIVRETKLLARHSTVYALGAALQRATAVVLLPIYTSYLTPSDYGIKEMVTLTTDVIGILVSTAISSAIYRFYFEQPDQRSRNCIISTANIALGIGGLATVGLALLAARPLAGMLLDNVGLAHYFALGLGSLWFQSQNKVVYTYLRAEQKSVQTVAYSLLNLLISVGLNIYLVVHLRLGVLGILISALVASAAMFVILSVPMILRTGLRFERKVLREMLRFGLPLVPSQIGGFVVHLSDRFFLKAYAPMAEVGLYSLAYRIGTMPSQFISEPFNQTWMPRRFEIAREQDSERVFGRIFTWFVALITFAGLMISGLAPDLLKIMSDRQFWSATTVIPVIVLANILFTFHYHFNIGIMLENRTKDIAWINITNAVMILALNWWMIPRWGAMGAALATLVGFVYKSGLTYVVGRRYYRIHFEFRRVGKVIAAASAVFLGLQFVNAGPPWLDFAVRGLLIAVLYPTLLFAMRFFTTGEIEKVRHKVAELRRRG